MYEHINTNEFPIPTISAGDDNEITVEWEFFGFSVYPDGECVIWRPNDIDQTFRVPTEAFAISVHCMWSYSLLNL